MKTRIFISFVSGLSAAILVLTGCSTMSRTEKQLAKVDSYDAPDIPAPGMAPPLRPVDSGLEYSSDVV
ncbi:MAG: hypothetical protein J5886_02615, partial [Bacteroidales bacterium]|nr:hypothetical protein [Bacteroidales bacterium]